MIWFTHIGKNDILFQFYDRELPEQVPFPREAVLNKIRYPGGHQTNQVIGVYRGEVEWSGVFHGVYNTAKGTQLAKNRSDLLDSLVGKPLRVGFPMPDGNEQKIPGKVLPAQFAKQDTELLGGEKGVYIIESYVPTVRNNLHVEYTIRLVPHERQEKIEPEKTTNVRVQVVSSNLSAKGVATATSGVKNPAARTKGAAAVTGNLKTTTATQGGKRPVWDEVDAEVEGYNK